MGRNDIINQKGIIDWDKVGEGYSLAKGIPDLVNAVKENTSQLAENTQKFNEVDADILALQTDKADKTEINTLATEKAAKAEVEVERQRINEMQSIPVGGTSADAALNDIKIGMGGEVYDTPATAVREQIAKIAEVNSYKNIFDDIIIYPNKYISQYDGNVLDGSGNTTTDFIPFTNGQSMHFFDATEATALIRWSVYDTNKVFVAGDFIYLSEHEGNINYNALAFAYLRFSYEDATVKAYYGTSKTADTYNVKYNALPTKLLNKLYYLVDKNGNGDFTTVTDACNNVPSGSIIYINPGIYDNEVITGTWSKKLYLFGTSAQDCIIKNSNGDYNRPPIQIGAGYLKSLTFYAEKGVGSPEHNGGATMEYAVHSESDNLYNDNLTIEDCILISDYAPAFGMGMRGGCHVVIKNCQLLGNYSGALLFHDADNASYIGEQNISVRDCLLYEKNAQTCLIMQSQGRTGTTVILEMLRNRLKSQGSVTYETYNYYGGTGGVNDFLGLINFRLKETSWGNSDATFNAS